MDWVIASSGRALHDGNGERLLEFARSRLGGGTLPVYPQMVDLGDVCNDALADARAMHPHCAFELVAHAPLEACVDADRIHQLLVNLLGNAGQHGAPGRPIQVQVAGDEDDAVLCVINEGRHTRRVAEGIFEPWCAAAECQRNITVSSQPRLGLHIASEIALAMAAPSPPTRRRRTRFTCACQDGTGEKRGV